MLVKERIDRTKNGNNRKKNQRSLFHIQEAAEKAARPASAESAVRAEQHGEHGQRAPPPQSTHRERAAGERMLTLAGGKAEHLCSVQAP